MYEVGELNSSLLRKGKVRVKVSRCGGSLPFRSVSVPNTLAVKIQLNP